MFLRWKRKSSITVTELSFRRNPEKCKANMVSCKNLQMLDTTLSENHPIYYLLYALFLVNLKRWWWQWWQCLAGSRIKFHFQFLHLASWSRWSAALFFSWIWKIFSSSFSFLYVMSFVCLIIFDLICRSKIWHLRYQKQLLTWNQSMSCGSCSLVEKEIPGKRNRIYEGTFSPLLK